MFCRKGLFSVKEHLNSPLYQLAGIFLIFRHLVFEITIEVSCSVGLYFLINEINLLAQLQRSIP